MNFLLFVFLLVCVILAIPYIRQFIKRIELAFKISDCCKKNNFLLHKTHTFWMFGSARSYHCDFYIETIDTIYSLKLFGVKRYHSELFFTYDNKYFIRNYIAFAAGMFSRIPVDSAKKNLHSYDFKYDFHEDWHLKKFKPVLLINPVCYQINYCTRTGSEIIGSGEIYNDMYISSLSGFIRDITMDVNI